MYEIIKQESVVDIKKEFRIAMTVEQANLAADAIREKAREGGAMDNGMFNVLVQLIEERKRLFGKNDA